MRWGSYARRTANHEFLVDVNHVAFFNPHEAPCFSHPCGERNAGLTVRVCLEPMQRVLADVCSRRPVDGERPFCCPVAISSPRCHLLQNILLRTLYRQKAPDSALVETLIFGLIREALAGLQRDGAYPASGVPRNQSAPGGERIATVRRYLVSHWAERLTLSKLAGVAGCSTWHLASIFRAHTGLSLHAYIKRLRLRHALKRLDERVDLTCLAFECGFSSHSHFTAAFRQEFGTTPSSVRPPFHMPLN
jgi:AraC-like DNA-binding protein